MKTRPMLTLEDCRKITAAAEAEARKNNWNVVIAILDDGGHLLHFVRDVTRNRTQVPDLNRGARLRTEAWGASHCDGEKQTKHMARIWLHAAVLRCNCCFATG